MELHNVFKESALFVIEQIAHQNMDHMFLMENSIVVVFADSVAQNMSRSFHLFDMASNMALRNIELMA